MTNKEAYKVQLAEYEKLSAIYGEELKKTEQGIAIDNQYLRIKEKMALDAILDAFSQVENSIEYNRYTTNRVLISMAEKWEAKNATV